MAKSGVYTAKKKDGTVYYRASITYKRKHISLGSYLSEAEAYAAYREADDILRKGRYDIWDCNDYKTKMHSLPLDKFVILLNLREHGLYFKTPIYLYPGYFEYYLSSDTVLLFDRDDLFFYASHKIMIRGGRLFYCDYGAQYGILSRYGLKSYSVPGRDFRFANGNANDYRYANIQVINRYMGVLCISVEGHTRYQVLIHVVGNYQVGIYEDEDTAAIAYNKAADILMGNGISKRYIKNYIPGLSSAEYKDRYAMTTVSPKLYAVR
ncbi:MAG: hypothetical protein K2G89_00460 [Lachnospiraceae bacterium]|nr:hypothetical protein [Lachnospiraceae bacterium]